ncbi:MAG: hypothetical protein RID09_13465 [Coleofasciculus sp. G1-WW12-02]|uniref:hypothetical protein n=1 Tax=Coleofasciculus sp. G1-WW12-02 TaxID=3068483 RepID=UPI003302AD96
MTTAYQVKLIQTGNIQTLTIPQSNQRPNPCMSGCGCSEMYRLQWFERPDSYYHCRCDRTSHRFNSATDSTSTKII